ncbi:helix-turn-helix domain-containing protein [Polaromonas sp. C04]|uniref:helix-turn-helix domain-containing protein n=1 Tax=Polaromonas sp. C04 TaxID=1945857 RepID=UPI001186B58B|nr:helix-turn-helix domain-containing protein [Polaromonas sp. C04]
MTAANDKGPGRQSKPFDKNTTTARKFSAKSTATEAQYERIVRMLRIGERSTFDFRKAGIMAPAARIKELNDKHGFYIPTVALRDLWDEEGFCHPRVAVYSLVDEPANGERT